MKSVSKSVIAASHRHISTVGFLIVSLTLPPF